MPAAPRGTSVEHELRIDAPPATVFAFFTDPSRMVEWMGSAATLDPRPGGVFRIVFRPTPAAAALLDPDAGGGASEENVVLGEFVAVEPPSRIVFTWGYEREHFRLPPQSTEVEVALVPDGDGTLLRLTHRRLPEAAAGFHRAGWDHYLPRLEAAATGDDPGVDPLQAA
jgi:uncharacterized protein YndB with AHSA1/START domain